MSYWCEKCGDYHSLLGCPHRGGNQDMGFDDMNKWAKDNVSDQTRKEVLENGIVSDAKIYPNSYDRRVWMSTSLEGCVGYKKGAIEYGIVDDDGGIMIAFCRFKKDADEIANKLNGKPQAW